MLSAAVINDLGTTAPIPDSQPPRARLERTISCSGRDQLVRGTVHRLVHPGGRMVRRATGFEVRFEVIEGLLKGQESFLCFSREADSSQVGKGGLSAPMCVDRSTQ